MGLTDEESRLFNSLVSNLDAPDKKLTVDGVKARKLVIHVLLTIVGLALLLTGVIVQNVLVGIAGFGCMLYSVNSIIKLSRFSGRN